MTPGLQTGRLRPSQVKGLLQDLVCALRRWSLLTDPFRRMKGSRDWGRGGSGSSYRLASSFLATAYRERWGAWGPWLRGTQHSHPVRLGAVESDPGSEERLNRKKLKKKKKKEERLSPPFGRCDHLRGGHSTSLSQP